LGGFSGETGLGVGVGFGVGLAFAAPSTAVLELNVGPPAEVVSEFGGGLSVCAKAKPSENAVKARRRNRIRRRRKVVID
jgi:hypothetical protein